MLAPADNSICTIAASPLAAAQCRAVIPSPCAAFTSAPVFNSALTATASLAFAASATSDEDACTPTTNAMANTKGTIRLKADATGLRLDNIEIHCLRTVTELLNVDADRIQCREHRVRHRRAVVRFDVTIAFQRAACMSSEEQRAAFVIVEVGVAHRRS